MKCLSRDDLHIGRIVVALDVERILGIRNGICCSVSTIPDVVITHGVHMTKTLLILLLMTMQLLAGSGASVYLCIGCDGSYGIETNTESCLCDGKNHTDGESCACDCDDQHCEHRESPAQVQLAGEGVSRERPCGCTHIPLIVSSDRYRHFVRSLANHKAGRVLFLAAAPSNDCFSYAVASCTELRWHVSRADVPAFSLIVVSTVIIRC